MLAFSAAQAQEGAITGTVISGQSLEPANAAQVFIPGTDIGTLTDREGQYRLSPVPVGEVTVEVRLIGFRSQTQTVNVTAGQLSTLDFQLEISAVRLEDVTVNVVTGLERRRRQLGTNSTTVRASEVNTGQIQDFSDFLAGRAEGVIMNDVSGTTGTSQRIRIRGNASISLSNEPLIIVDGVYFANPLSGDGVLESFGVAGQEPSRLNDLNPEDIDNIEVIKGPAAAALYGTVGANGVILITTKRGTPGGTDWHFYGELSQLEDRTDWPLNYEAVQIIGDESAPVFTESGFNSTDYASCLNFEAADGDCTQDLFLTFNTLTDPRTTFFQKGDRAVYGMNVGGGTPTATYFISGEYKKEDGIIAFDFNNEERFSVRTNLDAALADELNAALSIGFVSRDLNLLSNDNSIFGTIINGIAGTAGFVPGGHPNEATGGPNPLNYRFSRNLQDLLEASGGSQQTERFTASVNASWQPLEWLSAQGTFGVDLASSFDFQTIQPGLDNLAADWVEGYRAASRYNRQNWTGNVSVSGTFDIPGTDIGSVTTAGASYQEELLEEVECFGAGLIDGTGSCSSTSTRFFVDEDFLNIVTVGAFFQQEFSLGDKLFLTGALRLDDNSNFGGNSTLEAYPSASLSYLISDEDFFPQSDILSEVRLRGSWGVAGLRPGFRDAITRFGPVTATILGEDVPGVTLSETGNELLKPERSTEWEGGVDLGLFNDRVGVGFTYFNKNSQDALIERQLAPSFGLTTSLFENLGEVRNRGTEMSVRALALDKRDARVNVTLQWTTMSNEVVELGEGVEPITFGEQRHEEGFPGGSFWSEPVTFSDADGDGLLSIDEVEAGDDDVFINEAFPTWTASLNLDMELFQFLRVSTLFDARGGNSQFNNTERFRCDSSFINGRGCEKAAGEFATLEEQATWVAARFHGARTLFIDESDFIKWREVSITLSAPPSLASKHPLLERSTLTLSGRNLQTFTGYDGVDPEINSAGGSANFGQSEFFTQPPVRVFTLRLAVRF
jgi:TonB-linked SusC/RagA family outer membrane protein